MQGIAAIWHVESHSLVVRLALQQNWLCECLAVSVLTVLLMLMVFVTAEL